MEMYPIQMKIFLLGRPGQDGIRELFIQPERTCGGIATDCAASNGTIQLGYNADQWGVAATYTYAQGQSGAQSIEVMEHPLQQIYRQLEPQIPMVSALTGVLSNQVGFPPSALAGV